MLTIPQPPRTFYTCPGERHPISRAVHQARLSRHYAACRECPHRDETCLVTLSKWSTASPSRNASGLVFTADGLRGRYLNDLTRRHAQQWATALAVTLWNERPLSGRMSDQHEPDSTVFRSGPVVAVGYDERPASPDLALGVVTGLRQAGCHVIDVGQSTPAAWRFAVQCRQTDAGMFVTGAGYDASWTGFDFLGPDRMPLDPQVAVANLVDATSTLIARPTRFAGAVETLSVWSDYEAQLAKQFHALRPLKVVAVVLSSLVERLLGRLFAPLPCRLTFAASAPLRWEVAMERLQAAVREQSGDLGVLIGEDGRQFALVDETGKLVAAEVWQPWLLLALDVEQPESSGEMGDAIVTLAALLRALSWSDATLSERLPR